jgi:hypothetical protein
VERGEQAAIGTVTLQPCLYRAERSYPNAEMGSGPIELTCKATGGNSLGRKGDDDAQIARICNTCTIPQEAAFRPCLYLVPIKARRNGVLKDYFICRFFYRLRPDRPEEKTRFMCGGCPYWFPMPPIELLHDLERAARAMIDYHTRIWDRPPSVVSVPIWTPEAAAPTTWWRRASETVRRWWGW